ncbi:MAG: type I restriction-modification system subunit M [Flavobacteriales bacterium]
MTSKQRLEATLWDIANTLRGKMAADDFRDYILGFIFYKYLSEKMELYADEVLHPDGLLYTQVKEGTTEGDAYLQAVRDLSLDQLGYFLKPSELFSTMVQRSNAEGKANFILDDLTKVLNSISDSTRGTDSEEDFANLFEDLDLTSSKLGKSTDDKNKLVVKVLAHLDGIDFELDNPSHDVLGDAYEYLIGQFASGAGKKAGEFYTPQEVSTVLARIVTTGKKRLKSVYDPTCGSGSLLLRVAKEVLDVGQFYGQEMNPTTYNLCRMNMIMHDVHYRRFDIKNEDTLERPQHPDMQFEAVVANPPFSAHWKADPLKMNDERFGAYGKLAPTTKADFAFVQHMVHHLGNDGTMACVLPHGVLFRGAAEGHIRQYLIEECNYLDAVIGLPANIFYGTSIPTCILVLKKQREHAGDILFIDSSAEGNYEKVKTQNKLRPQDIDKIISTYRERRAEAKYSHVAPLAEVRENDYNLNIPRYVDTFEEEEAVDLNAVAKELRSVASSASATDALIAAYCKELGIEMPVA